MTEDPVVLVEMKNIEIAVDEESESDSRGSFLQIAQGKGRESVTLGIATLKQTNMRHMPTHTNPKDL